MNILVIDDNRTNRKLLRALLETEGYRVIEAEDGLTGLETLERKSPIDLIISDVLMPRMDGFRLCYELRRLERFKDISFIIYTATYTSAADEKLALDLGADRFITRPSSNELVLTAVRDVTSQPRPADGRARRQPSDLVVMREYSEVLVQKLEDKINDLEHAQQELQRKNDELENAQRQLKEANEALERRVRERTLELEIVNKELEAFSYSVSHDLRAPIRAVNGFAKMLMDECLPSSSEAVQLYYARIESSLQRMEELIANLLRLSRASRSELNRERVSLSVIAHEILERLQQEHPQRDIEVDVEPGVTAECDAGLLQITMENLLGNAWKFTRLKPVARIQFGCKTESGKPVYFVRDNGVGFDMSAAEKLFGAFQRFHASTEYPGTGIGLATVQRIIHRHGGHIWAESKLNEGTTFYFTL